MVVAGARAGTRCRQAAAVLAQRATHVAGAASTQIDGAILGDAATRDGATGDAQASGDAGASDASVKLPDPQPVFTDLAIRPDVPTTKVSDCTGQPDLTLCDVVTTPDLWYDVCVAGKCISPGTCDLECNTSGPHFRMPPMAGGSTLQKQDGDQPVSIDLATGLHWTSCFAGQNRQRLQGHSRHAARLRRRARLLRRTQLGGARRLVPARHA